MFSHWLCKHEKRCVKCSAVLVKTNDPVKVVFESKYEHLGRHRRPFSLDRSLMGWPVVLHFEYLSGVAARPMKY